MGKNGKSDETTTTHSSPPAGAAAVTNLEVVELGLERLDRAVGHLEVLVEPVALRNELVEMHQYMHRHHHTRDKYAHAAPTA